MLKDAGFSELDLMTINQIIKTPLNTNYVGGAQKNKNNIHKFIDQNEFVYVIFLKNIKHATKLQYV